MKIVHVIDFFNASLGYQETFLMKTQAAAGHEVHMITSNLHVNHIHSFNSTNTSNSCNNRITSVSTNDNAYVHRLPSFYSLYKLTHRAWLSKLEILLHSLNPDFVHVHGIQSFTSLRVARYKIKGFGHFKLLFDSHGAYYNSRRSMNELFYRLYKNLFSSLFIHSSDAIVAIDRWCKEFLIEKCGIPKKYISMIPLGADHNLFKYSVNDRINIRSKLNISDNDPVFIYTGKLNFNKGVHILVDAMRQVLFKLPHSTLIIVGSGEPVYLNYIREMADNIPNSRIFFYSHVPNYELPRFYSASDISIWPCQISIGTYEAQSCGLPLIVADTPELLDRISYGNGISYLLGDSTDLAKAMIWLYNNYDIRKQMSKTGRDVIESTYNWQVITQQFMSSVGLTL